jgi:hypothetical protein
MNSIEIPVKDSEEIVEISLDELPDSPSEIIDILVSEEAQLNVYETLAVSDFVCLKLARV